MEGRVPSLAVEAIKRVFANMPPEEQRACWTSMAEKISPRHKARCVSHIMGTLSTRQENELKAAEVVRLQNLHLASIWPQLAAMLTCESWTRRDSGRHNDDLGACPTREYKATYRVTTVTGEERMLKIDRTEHRKIYYPNRDHSACCDISVTYQGEACGIHLASGYGAREHEAGFEGRVEGVGNLVGGVLADMGLLAAQCPPTVGHARRLKFSSGIERYYDRGHKYDLSDRAWAVAAFLAALFDSSPIWDKVRQRTPLQDVAATLDGVPSSAVAAACAILLKPFLRSSQADATVSSTT